MTENESVGNAGKKRKGQCDLSLSHASSASFSENNSRHGDWGGAVWLIQNAIICKNVDKADFGSDLMKWTQVTRSIRREDIDFRQIMDLAFHDLPKKEQWLVDPLVRSGSEKMHGSNFP